MTGEQSIQPGLQGVVASRTAVASVAPEQVLYRGFDLRELVERAQYEEVLHLFVYGELPNRRQLSLLHDTLIEHRRLPSAVVALLRSIPTNVALLPVLRSAVSLLEQFDPIDHGDEHANARRSVWLSAAISAMLAARYRISQRKEPLNAKPGLSFAGQVLYQLTGNDAEQATVTLFDRLLMVWAEAGLNPQAFSARVVASASGELLPALVAAFTASCGMLPTAIVDHAHQYVTRFESASEVASVAGDKDVLNKLIPQAQGGGSASEAARVAALEFALRDAADSLNGGRPLAIYDALRDIATQRGATLPIEYAECTALTLLGLPHVLHLPLRMVGQIAGLCAHAAEQCEDAAPFRPKLQYQGELPRPVPRISLR